MKFFFRINPVDLYNIHEVENWLKETANQGLTPLWIGSFFSIFLPKLEVEMQFCLEPTVGWKEKPALQQHYKGCGWEELCSVAGFFTLFTAKKEMPLPCENKILQKHSAQWARKRASSLQKVLWTMPMMILFIVAFCLLLPSDIDAQPDKWARLPLLLLEMCNLWVLSMLCVITVFCIQTFQEKKYREQCQNLSGLPVSSISSDNRKTLMLNKVGLIVCGLVIVFGANDYLQTRTMPIETFTQPYIQLSDIEKVPISSWEELYEASTFHGEDNQAEYINSLIAPKAYIVNQKGFETISTYIGSFSPKGGEHHYAPSLEMAYFRMISPILTRPMAESQMDYFRAVNIKWSYREVTFPELDFVILAEANNGVEQMVALGCGRDTVIFCYSGLEKLENHLPKLATLIIDEY